MTIEQFRKHMADGLPVENGSEAHQHMHQMSQEALRITAEINGMYHEPAELRKLLHQTPWYDEEGSIAGLIELAIDLPDEMPVFNRDKE